MKITIIIFALSLLGCSKNDIRPRDLTGRWTGSFTGTNALKSMTLDFIITKSTTTGSIVNYTLSGTYSCVTDLMNVPSKSFTGTGMTFNGSGLNTHFEEIYFDQITVSSNFSTMIIKEEIIQNQVYNETINLTHQ